MSLLSMTGFGSGDSRQDGIAISVQITSLNRKHLDVHVTLPKELSQLESTLRAHISKQVGRGAVYVKVNLTIESPSMLLPKVDLQSARVVYQELMELKTALSLAGDITLRELLASPQFSIVKPSVLPVEQLTEMTNAAVHQALAALIVAKTQEGRALTTDLSNRRQRLLEYLAVIIQYNQAAPERAYLKMKARVQQLLQEIPIDDERLLKEIAILADRCDVSEEITRLQTHLEQMGQLLAQSESAGRKLDFLMQEIQREISTTGAKCSEAEVSKTVIEFKIELERMREQVQNIE